MYFGREVFIPLAFGGILSMLLLPLCHRLEDRGMNKALAAIISVFFLLLVAAGIIAILVWRISDLASDLSGIQKQVNIILDKFQSFLTSALGITAEKQKELVKQEQSSGTAMVTKLIAGIMSFLVDFVLVVVYTFFFLYLRDHFKKFILKLVPAEKMNTAEKVIGESAKVSYQYLSGMAIMIVMLWVLYGIGFSLAGLKSALFFAVLCGLLEMVPFVGNLTGTTIAVLMAVSQGGGGGMVLAVLVTYLVVQFIQSYIISPLIVGSEVNINPMFSIVILVVGESVWGVAGMVLAIPLLGMIKIIFDNIISLKPYAYLIGGDSTGRKNEGVGEKIKKFFKKKKQGDK